MRALISVSDKTGIVDLARGLQERGVTLLSTGGTARTLTAAGLSVTQVSDVTGLPEMMDGRVKTLHPAVHGGILARRANAADLAALAQRGFEPIDMVVVNLYPFEATAADTSVAVDDLIEQIDIGGPSMIRSASKNFRDVLVVVSPDDYPRLLEALDHPGGAPLDLRLELARRAFEHTAAYDAAIATELARVSVADGTCVRGPRDLLSARFQLAAARLRTLRYGENPHQAGAWYSLPSMPGVPAVLQGKALSFTNLLDVDAALRMAAEFREPAAVVVKHTNPCGVATGSSLAAAYVTARDADALSAFGGIVGCNRDIDDETARAIASTFIEAVVAPGISESARAVLAAKANLRVVMAPDLFRALTTGAGHLDLRSALGGLLAQEQDRVVEAQDPWPAGNGPEVVTSRAPTADEWHALRFAWRVCAHVKSNAVIFTRASQTLAIGAGQMSRVDAVNVAVAKARASRVDLTGSVAASDAFFPFRDGLDALVAAGATAVVQPGGSVRDAEVVAAANEHGMAMVFTRKRHFRH